MKKKLLAASLAAAMCLSLAGCAQNNNEGEVTEDNIESIVESVLGGDTQNSTPESESATESSEPEEEKPEILDEIKNAELTSGKIQIFDEIFEPFGTMTVEEFVEKYKDKFDITYKDGAYEECKDYLLEYGKDDEYSLILKPKTSNYFYYKMSDLAKSLTVKIANLTSSDEKVTIDKGYVVGLNWTRSSTLRAPQAFPGGFMSDEFANVMKAKDENFVNPYADFTRDDFREYLIDNGFVECNNNSDDGMKPKSTDYKCFCELQFGDKDFWVRFCTEKAVDGTIPQPLYIFEFDKDTDKLNSVAFLYVNYYTEEKIAANQ